MRSIVGHRAASHGPWRAMVVDAHAPSRRVLAALLAQYVGIDVVGEYHDADDAWIDVQRAGVDLAFVDVQLPGAMALDAVRVSGVNSAPIVVYTTADADYALRAVETHAENYLLKPFSKERFMHTMARVKTALENSHAIAVGGRPRSIHVQAAQGPLSLPVATIDWIQAEDYCSCLHLGRRRLPVRRSFGSLLEELGGDGFMRTHRSVIVNVRRVRDVRVIDQPSGDAEVRLATGAVLPVSRSYRPQLENRVKDLAFRAP